MYVKKTMSVIGNSIGALLILAILVGIGYVLVNGFSFDLVQIYKGLRSQQRQDLLNGINFGPTLVPNSLPFKDEPLNNHVWGTGWEWPESYQAPFSAIGLTFEWQGETYELPPRERASMKLFMPPEETLSPPN